MATMAAEVTAAVRIGLMSSCEVGATASAPPGDPASSELRAAAYAIRPPASARRSIASAVAAVMRASVS